MKRIRNGVGAMLVSLILLSAPMADAQRDNRSRDEERTERDYQRGLKRLNDHRYEEAVEIFRSVADRGDGRAAGALYWQAWSMNKLNEKAEALQVLARLKTEYPESSWVDDARALEVEVRQESGQDVEPESIDDEEVRLMALHSLSMHSPEKALPALEKILEGAYSMKMKKKALFVLTQMHSKDAGAMLEEVALGRTNPDLQLAAIDYIGTMGSRSTRALLDRIYRESQSARVKEKVLNAWMVSGNKAQILNAARSEPSEQLRGKAISLLGVIGAQSELLDLYRTESSVKLKKKAIEGLFISHAHEAVERIARTEKNRELRIKAIESLGVMGKDTGPTLVDMYETESDREIRKKVLGALFIQSNADALIRLARKEEDREMKKEIISKLSLMGSEEARNYMLELLGVD